MNGQYNITVLYQYLPIYYIQNIGLLPYSLIQMQRILPRNNSVGLLTTAVMATASFMISLLVFTDYIEKSSIRIFHYILIFCLIAYLIIIFCKAVLFGPKFSQMHSLNQYVNKDEERVDLQRKNKIKDKKTLETLTKFQDYVRQISNKRHEQRLNANIEYGGKNNYYSHQKNFEIVELVNHSEQASNFQISQKQRQWVFNYGSNDTLINKLSSIMKQTHIFKKRTKESLQNDKELVGVIEVNIKKQNVNQAYLAIRTEVSSLLQSTVFVEYSRIFSQLSATFQKYFNLRLSSHSSDKTISIAQLRKAIKIYEQKKLMPLKFRQNMIHDLDRQAVANLYSMLKSIPDFQRYDSFRLSLCLLCISNLYPQQAFVIIDSNNIEMLVKNKQLQFNASSYELNSAKVHHQPHKIYMLTNGFMKYEGLTIKQIDSLLLRLLIKISKNYFRIQNSLHKAMRMLLTSQNEKNYQQLDQSRIGVKNPFKI